ncbi:MAG: DUF6553 family protein [Eubacteriales bacterium]|jgi:hypothetical protein
MEKKPWVVQYMHETDKNKRKELLDQAVAVEGVTPENELRQKLYDARYVKVDGTDADRFVAGWMAVFYLRGTTKSIFSKKKIEKIRKELVDDWQMELIEAYGETGREVLYEELFNMTKLYIELCQQDRGYNSVLFELGKIKEDTLKAKIADDVFTNAYTTMRDTGLDQEFSIFTRAATDAYCEIYSRDRDLLLGKVRKFNSQ